MVSKESLSRPQLVSFGVCDDVRFEQFGKLTLIGFYGQGIRVAKLPTVLSKLAFFAFFSYFEEPSTVSVRLLSPSGIVVLEAQNVQLVIDTQERNLPQEFRQNLLFFQVVPMQLNESGTYRVSFQFQGHPEITANFHVSAIGA